MSNEFQARHIGPNAADTAAMLQTIGVASLDQLIEETVRGMGYRLVPP